MTATSEAPDPQFVPREGRADAVLDELVHRRAKTADPSLHHFRSWIGARGFKRLYELIPRFAPEGGRVLDWGAGHGHLSYYLVRSGYQAVGYSFQGYTFADRMPAGSYDYVQADPAEPVKLPFEDASMDTVISCGVLEHVRQSGGNEAGSLAEIRRVLKPGGHFLCYHFPNRYSAIEWVAARLGKRVHEYKFSRAEVLELVRNADFELLELDRYSALPRLWAGRLPATLRNSRRLADVYDAADDVLALPLGPICQNHAFVARRPH